MDVNSYFFAFNQDGMYYGTGSNMTYKNYQDPSQCGKSIYHMDQRCQEYFEFVSKSEQDSILIYPPTLLMQGMNNQPYISYGFCKKVFINGDLAKKYENILSTNHNLTLFSIICNSVKQNEAFFSNNYSNYTYILYEPTTYRVIYQTGYQIPNDTAINLQETYINKIDSELQKKIFQDEIDSFYSLEKNKLCSLNKDEILGLIHNKKAKDFKFIFEKQEMLVNMQFTSIFDKNQTFDKNYQANYCFKSSLVFLSIASNYQLQQQTMYFQDKINKINLILNVIFALIISLLLAQAFVRQKRILNLINVSAGHLIEVLNKIRFDTQTKDYILFEEGNIFSEDFQVDFSRLFLSKDMQILYNCFQTIFQTLICTTQNSFNLNQSQTLIQLSRQVKYFQQFKNHKALGICYNHIGNMHFCNGRFLEALQNYSTSILHCQYEQKLYQESKKDMINHQRIEEEQKRKSVLVINSIFQKKLNFLQKIKNNFKKQKPDSIFKMKKSQIFVIQDISEQNLTIQGSQKEEVEVNTFQTLFNRKYNYVLSLIYFMIQNKNESNWDLAEQCIFELKKIRNTKLAFSIKENIILNQILIYIYARQNKIKESEEILNRSQQLYEQLKSSNQNQNSNFNYSNHDQSNEALSITSSQINRSIQSVTNNNSQLENFNRSFTSASPRNQIQNSLIQMISVRNKENSLYSTRNYKLSSDFSPQESKNCRTNLLTKQSINNNTHLQKKYKRVLTNRIERSISTELNKLVASKNNLLNYANQNNEIQKQEQNNLQSLNQLNGQGCLIAQVDNLALKENYLAQRGEDQSLYDFKNDIIYGILLDQVAIVNMMKQNFYQAADAISKLLEESQFIIPFMIAKNYKRMISIFDQFKISHPLIDQILLQLSSEIIYVTYIVQFDCQDLQKYQFQINDNQGNYQQRSLFPSFSEQIEIDSFQNEELEQQQKNEKDVDLYHKIIDKVLINNSDCFGFSASFLQDMSIQECVAVSQLTQSNKNLINLFFSKFLAGKNFMNYKKESEIIQYNQNPKQEQAQDSQVLNFQQSQSKFMSYQQDNLNQKLQKRNKSFSYDLELSIYEQRKSKIGKEFSLFQKSSDSQQLRQREKSQNIQQNQIKSTLNKDKLQDIKLNESLQHEMISEIKVQKKQENLNFQIFDKKQNGFQLTSDFINSENPNIFIKRYQEQLLSPIKEMSSKKIIESQIKSNLFSNMKHNKNHDIFDFIHTEIDFEGNNNQQNCEKSLKQINNLFLYKQELKFNESNKLPQKSFQIQQNQIICDKIDYKNNNRDNFYEIQMKKKQLFYFSIRKAIQQVIIQHNENNIQLLQTKLKVNMKNCQKNEKQNKIMDMHNAKCKQELLQNVVPANKLGKKFVKKYIITILEDISLIEEKDQQFKMLQQWLHNFKIELCILIKSDKLSTEEESKYKTININNQDIISYFYSEKNLINYLIFNRCTKYHDNPPIVFEHF